MAEFRRKLYFDLVDAFKKAFPNKRPAELQSETNSYWASIKNEERLTDIVKNKLCELQRIETKCKAKLMTFWTKVGYVLFIFLHTHTHTL